MTFRRPPFAPDAPAEAEQRLKKALELSRQLVADHPGVSDYAASRVRIHLMLAEFLRRADQRVAAEESLREALALQAPLVQRFPEIRSYHFWLAVVQQSLARLLRDPQDLEEARTLMEASIDTLTQSLKDDPRPNHVRWLLVGSHFELADIYTRLDEEDLAEEARRQAQDYR